jgi:hypothetical protein
MNLRQFVRERAHVGTQFTALVHPAKKYVRTLGPYVVCLGLDENYDESEVFRGSIQEQRTQFGIQYTPFDPFDARPHGVGEIAYWIGDMDTAVGFIALGEAMGLWDVFSPDDLPRFPHAINNGLRAFMWERGDFGIITPVREALPPMYDTMVEDAITNPRALHQPIVEHDAEIEDTENV